MLANVQRARAYQGDPPLSRPGTWAYPDMLEVGRMPSLQEDRAHFGLWVITSSPLILGLDLANRSDVDRVWEVIANPEAIAINQAWAGHPGWMALETVQTLPEVDVKARPCRASSEGQHDWELAPVPGTKLKVYQIRSK